MNPRIFLFQLRHIKQGVILIILIGCLPAPSVATDCLAMLNNNFPLRDQGVSNALNYHLLPRHRWYFVKEGFSPKLVEQAVSTESLKSGEILFDPFSGSGTVPLTGAINGFNTRAFEVNPFLRFLSATKLKQTSPEALRVSSLKLYRAFKYPVPSPLEGYSTFTEGNQWDRWLFPLQVIQSFEAGHRALLKVDAEHRDLLKLALLGAVMDCCNATRDGKCLRYPKNWIKQQATKVEFLGRFEARVNMIADDLAETPLKERKSIITEGDARQLIAEPSKEKFHLCVTSPPYLNSFDYSDVYRPELFLGNFVNSNKSLMDVRLKTIRSHVQADWEHPNNDQFGELYEGCILKLKETFAKYRDFFILV